MSTIHKEGNIDPQTIGPNNKKNDLDVNSAPFSKITDPSKTITNASKEAWSLKKKIYTATILGFPAIILIAIIYYFFFRN